MRRLFVIAPPVPALIASLALLTSTQLFATNVSGTISTNTTWTTAGSPYILTGDVVVEGAAVPVLTIQAGVTVKFNAGANPRIGQDAAGELVAVGNSASPIVFTANGSTTPGFWSGVMLLSHTTSVTRMTWATVTYGGYSNFGYYFGGVRLAGSPATLTNVTVQSSLVAGVSVESGTPTIATCTLTTNPWGLYILGGTPTVNGSTSISSNALGGVFVNYPGSPSLQTATISGNTGYAMSQDSRVTLGTVSSLTVNTNTNDAIEIRSLTDIGANTRWKNVGLTYVVSAYIGVAGAASPVLTIDAGVTLKFAQNVSMAIGNGNPGGLQANGSVSQQIVFTANAVSPTPGYWGGIQFFDKTLSTSSISYGAVLTCPPSVVQSI